MTTEPAGLSRPRNVLISSAARKVPLVQAVVDAARRLDGTIRVYAGDLDPGVPAALVADVPSAGTERLPRKTSDASNVKFNDK